MSTGLEAQIGDRTPREVAAAAFAAHDSGDVAALVAMVDPESAAQFKHRQIAEDSMMAALAHMWDAERGERKTVLQAVFGVRDQSEFEQLTPEDVLTRWFDKSLRKGVLLESPVSEGAKREILGEVSEGETLVHVVFREIRSQPTDLPSGLMEEVHVRLITVRLTALGWRVTLNGGLVYDEGGGSFICYTRDDESNVPSQ